MEPGKKAFTLVWLFWSFGLELEVKSCLDDVSWLCERHLQTTSLAFCALWNLEVSLVKGHLKRSRVVHLFPPQLYFTPRAKVDQKNFLGKMTFGLTWVKIINIPRKKTKVLGLTWVKIINIPRKKQKEHQFRTVASYFLKGTLTYLGIFASRDWKAVGPPLLTSGSPSDLIPTVGRCRKRFCWFFAKQISHDEVSQLLLSSVIVKSTLFF